MQQQLENRINSSGAAARRYLHICVYQLETLDKVLISTYFTRILMLKCVKPRLKKNHSAWNSPSQVAQWCSVSTVTTQQEGKGSDPWVFACSPYTWVFSGCSSLLTQSKDSKMPLGKIDWCV